MRRTDRALRFTILVFFALAAVMFGSSLYASEDDLTTVLVFEHAEVGRDKIYLGEISAISGTDMDTVEHLKNIYIGQAPLPGKSRHVDASYIKVRLKQSGIDFSGLSIKIPKETVVLRKSNRISRKQIEKIVADNIYQFLPFDADQIAIKSIRVKEDAVLPVGEMTYSIVPPEKTDFLGKIPLSIYFQVNGQTEKRVYVTMETSLMANVVVARRPLKRNYTIKDIDVRLVRTDMADVPSNCVVNIDDVLGKKTSRSVAAGRVISTDLLYMPAIVDRRDVVRMIAETKNLKITAMGQCKEKGRKGDRIKVINLDSEETVYARVIDAKTVVVDF